ncbi:MAG: MarR family winged helix-turn-helix transcriptional regulator [Phycisphaerae bacterium]
MGTHVNPGGTDVVTVTSVLDSIRRIVRVLRVGSRAAEARLGLSGAQLFVLHALGGAPAASLNDLAARTRTHQSSVSVVVARLVELGLVARRRAPADARQWKLSITPAGRAKLRGSPDPAQAELIRATEGLSPADLAVLAGSLARLVEGLGAAGGAAHMFFEESAAVPDRRSSTTRRPRTTAARKGKARG